MSYSTNFGGVVVNSVTKFSGETRVGDFSSGWTEQTDGTAGQFVVSGAKNEILEWTRHANDVGLSKFAYLQCGIGVWPVGYGFGIRLEYEIVEANGVATTMSDGFLLTGNGVTAFQDVQGGQIYFNVEDSASATQGVTLRIGMGCLTADANVTYFRVKNLQLFLVETLTANAATQVVDPYIPELTGVENDGTNCIMGVVLNGTYSPALTLLQTNEYRSPVASEPDLAGVNPSSSPPALAFVGDSWFEGRFNLVVPFVYSNPEIAYRMNATGGRTVANSITSMKDLIGVSAGAPPFACVIGTWVNDSAGGQTAAQMYATVLTIRDELKALGVWPIFLNHPPVKTSAPWSSAMQIEIDTFNAQLAATTLSDDGFLVVDVYTALEGNVNADALSNTANGDSVTYDNGSGNHVLESGYAVIRPLIISAFNSLPNYRASLDPAQGTIATLDGYHSYMSVNRATVIGGVVTELDILGVGHLHSSGTAALLANGALDFNGSNTKYELPLVKQSTPTLTATAFHQIPDASGAAVGKGFTCTGLAPGPDGTWFVGNDGRTQEGDASPYASGVVKLSADFTTLIQEVTTVSVGLSPAGSVQGVVYLPHLNQVAFAFRGNETIHFLTADTMTYVGQFPGGTIAGLNGITYDESLDAMICMTAAGATTWRSMNDGSIIKSATLDGDSADMLWYDGGNGWLWYTTGGNGVEGRVRIRELENPVKDIAVIRVGGVQAIEGIALRDGKMWIANDQYYHPSGTVGEQLNRLVEFPLPTPSVWPSGSSTVQYFGVIRVPTSPAAAAPLIEIGNSLTDSSGNTGFWVNSTTEIQVGANRTFANFFVPSLATEVMFFASIDLPSDTTELWLNGVSVGVQAMSGSGTLIPDESSMADPRLGFNALPRYWRGEVRAVGAVMGSPESRQIVEGYMAHDVGRTDLLPADHPYKTSPPVFGEGVRRLARRLTFNLTKTLTRSI